MNKTAAIPDRVYVYLLLRKKKTLFIKFCCCCFHFNIIKELMLSEILTQRKALVISIYRVASCLSLCYAVKYSVFQSRESVGRSASITCPPVLTYYHLLSFPLPS